MFLCSIKRRLVATRIRRTEIEVATPTLRRNAVMTHYSTKHDNDMDIAKLVLLLAALPCLASAASDSDTVVLGGVRYTREEFEEWVREKQTLRILVVGETGVGKSTLINGLLGIRFDDDDRAAAGHDLTSETKRVREHREMMNGILVSVFDTPGLQDFEISVDSIIEDIKVETKSDIDLLLCCVDMSDKRLQRHHIETLQIVTDALGESIWERALVVLTHANQVEEPEPQNDLRKYFIRRLSEWERILKKVMIEKCNVPTTIVMKIPVVPAGHKKNYLPDRENWLSKLWVQAFRRLKFKAMIAFLKLSKNRLRHSIDDKVFTGLWTNQPIILSYMSYPEEMETVHNMATYGAVGGGAVGAVAGLVVGPIGPLVGTYLGGVIGGIIGTVKGSESSQHERVILQSLITALQDEAVDKH